MVKIGGKLIHTFDFNVSYSSCWGYSLINTLKLNKIHKVRIFDGWPWSEAWLHLRASWVGFKFAEQMDKVAHSIVHKRKKNSQRQCQRRAVVEDWQCRQVCSRRRCTRFQASRLIQALHACVPFSFCLFPPMSRVMSYINTRRLANTSANLSLSAMRKG